MSRKIISAKRQRGTAVFTIVNFTNKEVYQVYFQFSLKDMWLKPHFEDFGKSKIPLYGWLFFYFGRESVGFIEQTSDIASDEKCIIFDKHHNTYIIYALPKSMRKKFREDVKHGGVPRYNKEDHSIIMDMTA